MSSYKDAKECFLDANSAREYVEVGGNHDLYERLYENLSNPFKMILVYGKAGTGKSMLLHKLYDECRDVREIYYFPNPPSNREEFFKRLFKILTGHDMPEGTEIDFQTFVDFLSHVKGSRDIVMLLDEAQMYSDETLDEIRLLSDSEVMKFVLSLHEIEDDDIILQDHFRSRILEVLKFENLTKMELMDFIHKRLMANKYFDIANSIKEKQAKWIHKFTKGNSRESVKMMYAIMEIHEYYEVRSPSKIDRQSMSKKIIEMAAIKLGYIDV